MIESKKKGENLNLENFNKKRSYIYLGGNISPDDRTYQWRENFTELLKDESRVVIVDPTANAFNQKIRCQGNDDLDIDGVEFIKEAVSLSQDILMPKDYQMISMCNLAIFNLELQYPTKPMIGTLFEICWSFFIFHIPMIGIVGTKESQKDNPYTLHPWITKCMSARVRDEKQAAKIVRTFFLEY